MDKPPKAPLDPAATSGTAPHEGTADAVVDTLRASPATDAVCLYEGALRVLRDAANPGRLPLTASGLRELMDDLESAAGFAHNPPDWKQRIAQLDKAWRVAERSIGVGTDPDAFEGFARTLNDFFASASDLLSRRELGAATIEALDPAGRESPPAVRAWRADQWKQFREYFNLVLHRKTTPTAAQFEAKVAEFETFLLSWLRPRTFADFDEIDKLLTEVSAE